MDRDGTTVSSPPPNGDWERALEFARRHRVDILLSTALEIDAIESPSIRHTIEQLQSYTKRQNLSAAAALVDIVETLEDAGVAMITYKGPVVASRAYGDVSLRRFVDLDILVASSDRRRAIDALESVGYDRRQSYEHLSEVMLAHSETETIVDLHTDAVPDDIPASLPFEELYGRRTTVDVGGPTVPALSHRDAVTVHAIHGTKHCWYRGEWLLAVTALIRQSEDLGALFEHLRAKGCERMALCALVVTQRLFGMPYPDSLHEVVDRESQEWASVEATAAQFTRWITRPDWVKEEQSHLDGMRAQLRLCPSMSRKARFFVDTTTKPQEADREWISLPGLLSPLYRVVRPIRLVYRYRRSLVKR